MENEFAFGLNERLCQWRRALRTQPAIREEDIEELESHLSDTMDVLLKSGLSQEEAFLVGAHRIGHPVALADQFSCATPTAVWKERAQWMVLGLLSWWMASSLAKVGTSLILWLGGPLSHNGFALGWTGLAVQTLLILCFGWLAFGAITRDSSSASTARSTPVRALAARWIIYLSVGTLVFGISGSLLQAIAIRETGPSILGMYLAVTGWGAAVLFPGMVIAAGLWLARSTKLKSVSRVAILLLAGLLVGCNPSGESAKHTSASSVATTRFIRKADLECSRNQRRRSTSPHPSPAIQKMVANNPTGPAKTAWICAPPIDLFMGIRCSVWGVTSWSLSTAR